MLCSFLLLGLFLIFCFWFRAAAGYTSASQLAAAQLNMAAYRICLCNDSVVWIRLFSTSLHLTTDCLLWDSLDCLLGDDFAVSTVWRSLNYDMRRLRRTLTYLLAYLILTYKLLTIYTSRHLTTTQCCAVHYAAAKWAESRSATDGANRRWLPMIQWRAPEPTCYLGVINNTANVGSCM